MRLLGQTGLSRERLPLAAGQGVRQVVVVRGKSGYGFTMSGQGPCVLCGVLKGSPADDAGLRPGDCILTVNDTDVSEASHEAVAKLIGMSSEQLRLVVAASRRQLFNSCSSEEELAFRRKEKTHPSLENDSVGANRQSVGSFNTAFQHLSQSSNNSHKNRQSKQRPMSEPDLSYWAWQSQSKSNPDLLSAEETIQILSDDPVFLEPRSAYPAVSNLNMIMIVGYVNSMDLDLRTSDTAEGTLETIRGCISRIGKEQNTHSLVVLKITCRSLQLCDDRGVVLTSWPAENLVLCVICSDDKRFFALVSMDAAQTRMQRTEEGLCLKTLCHVFFVDPELCDHEAHKSFINYFGLECTPDPDTQGCLEFPVTPYTILHFVSVLYSDMGDFIEKLRLKLDREVADEDQTNACHSGSGDSGIGNVSPDRGSWDLIPDLSNGPVPNVPNHLWDRPPLPFKPGQIGHHRNSSIFKPGRRCLLSEPLPSPVAPVPLHGCSSNSLEVLADVPHLTPLACKELSQTGSSAAHKNGLHWPERVGIRARWQRPPPADGALQKEAEGSRPKDGAVPLDTDQKPFQRFAALGFTEPQATARQNENIRKLFNSAAKNKSAERKVSKLWALSRGRSSVRHSSRRSKHLSFARSLDDLETAATSDGERGTVGLRDSCSEASLDSNGSLPSTLTSRCPPERRVASWAICFERLLQDPVGVRYFTEFLRKEFSEENILFWQACEDFSQIPEDDKQQLCQRATEIYNSFVSSKAPTPVNIDSQAHLADSVLTAPTPDIFKKQQLQIFNLMKFDSYSRFLKSTLYQECILAEVEGQPLPDPYQVPCSPAPSKHSFNSDRSNATPRKEARKPRPVMSSEDIRDDRSDKKSGIFSWYRNRSFGKGPKKREIGDYIYAGSNGRRESQGSVSSGASQELNTTFSGGRSESDFRNSMGMWERERGCRQCMVTLPDGSTCPMALRQGASIRQVLLELCQKQRINLAAVDLFLIGGEKPLVLDQDSLTLSSRDLRLEKRTLFRLDLVPINRSVGLKAKPTKPVTEVLRPVVAKYGLRLSDLVARISGEAEVLDLGVPISNLDGLRVVLENADPNSVKDKSKKTHGASLSNRSFSIPGDDRLPGKPVRGENGEKHSTPDASDKIKTKKKHLEEAEELFELLSRAQSSRADDQRGILRKEDLVLPDFLRLNSDTPTCSTPSSTKPGHANPHPNGLPAGGPKPTPTDFGAPMSPIARSAGSWAPGQESLTDLTLVGEGDITSPNSTLLPLPPSPGPADPHEGSLAEANFTPPPPCISNHDSSGTEKVDPELTSNSDRQLLLCPASAAEDSPHLLDNSIGVEGVRLEENPELSLSFEGYVAELRQCQSRMQNGRKPVGDANGLQGSQSEVEESGARIYQATFV
ncbi:regulator of G-protein signaling 12 [Chanos chanos]|uniref:Regulator of G-protein signaling 12 n=1 Tax=Chanos chanos TaxID=29144 RepID=A0A6J2VTE8_CHACN|nr:regulator of G-protein signaling 12-like [Chanos chanos]